MRIAIISIIITLFAFGSCIAGKPIGVLINDDYVNAVKLPSDQEDFFRKCCNSTELILQLQKNIGAISPAIGQLKKIQTITLIEPVDSDNDGKGYNLTIPLELLNLPNLQTLKIYGFLNLRLPSGVAASQIHSHIERIIALDWGKNSIPFLINLAHLRQLILRGGQGAELPVDFSRLHNLRELQIEGNTEPLALGESLCGLAKLERLELSTQFRSSLPRCLERLTRLKSVTIASCRQETLPDNTKIYFPITLASLPNLEELNLWDTGRIEMPNSSYGFKKLRKLTISGYPDRNLYRICAVETARGLNLDAVVGYPNLQKIILRTMSVLNHDTSAPTYSDVEKDNGMGDYDGPILGIRSFIGLVDAAWKQGKLHSLSIIDMWEPMDGDRELITVWKRPSSRDKSGNTIPKNDVHWMLGKEREKVSSSK